MTDCAPLNAVIKMTRDYPHVWDNADKVHEDMIRKEIPTWNDSLCYINISAAISCLSDGKEPSKKDLELAVLCAALSTWRRNKNVYTFDSAIEQELMVNSEDLVIPVHILYHLPAACTYVQFPQDGTGNIDDINIDGFLAFIEDDLHTHELELRILYLSKDGEVVWQHYIHLLPGGTIYDGIQKAQKIIKENAMILARTSSELEAVIQHMDILYNQCCEVVQLLLYICAENADIKEDEEQIRIYRNPKSDKILDKYREIRKWAVGKRMGVILQQTRNKQTRIQGSGTPKKPHIRQSHWHHYWVGPRDNQELILRWLSPIIVNGDKNT